MKPKAPLSRLLLLILASLSLATAQAQRLLLVAGGNRPEVDIPATEAKLHEPFGCEFDSGGHLWIIEMVSGNRLLQVDGGGQISHIAGQLKAGDSGDGGPALRAQFNGPHNFAILPNDNLLIADTWNGRVREIDVRSRIVRAVEGWSAPKGKERGHGPYCITLSHDKSKLHIANLQQVIELDLKTHQSRVLAGNGRKGKPKDGALASEEPLVDPRAAAQDSKGNLYILERGGHALRVVSPDGRIRTVVNASGKVGSHGDGGPALDAALNGPKHLCVDRDDSVIIADAENHLVRRYVPATGRIERIAGTGKMGKAGLGGDPKNAELARPHGVTVHPGSGELYITDSYNDRILKIER